MKQKIFGIGFHKTGTKTLGECLKKLGYNHFSYSKKSRELLQELLLKKSLKGIFEAAEKYDSFEDWPWPLAYKELDKKFPNSKFILTIRKDNQTWLKSLKKHVEKGNFQPGDRKLIYGYATPHKNEKKFLQYYNSHNNEVKNYFKNRPKDFTVLCWEKRNQWKELCKFLNKEIPKIPFPHKNKGNYQI